MKPMVLMVILLGGVTMMLSGQVLGAEQRVSVEIDARDVVVERFMGFGAEWIPRNYPTMGITDADFALIESRVRWMRLPVVRIMMQAKWCYQGGGVYDWDNPQMAMLYRFLDVCQSLGTTVLLTDWGCEPEWLNCPDVANVDDPLYAEIIGTYTEYLLKTRGYTCIKYLIVVNEPNFEVKDWDRWKQAVENVSAQLAQRGLNEQVQLAGSDQSNADDWHRLAVDQLQHMLGAYDIHRYVSDSIVRPGSLEEYFRQAWDYARAHDPQASTKPMIVGEAGLSDGAVMPRGNNNIDSSYYGLFMADFAVQAANAGSSALMAWMLDDNSHPDFFWGLWTNRQQGLKLRPWFHPWSLIVRHFVPGCRIVRTHAAGPDLRVLAACLDRAQSPDQQDWTICLVNRADQPTTAHLRADAGPRLSMYRYLSSETAAQADEHGFPLPLDRQDYDLGAGADIICPASSVTLLSSLSP